MPTQNDKELTLVVNRMRLVYIKVSEPMRREFKEAIAKEMNKTVDEMMTELGVKDPNKKFVVPCHILRVYNATEKNEKVYVMVGGQPKPKDEVDEAVGASIWNKVVSTIKKDESEDDETCLRVRVQKLLDGDESGAVLITVKDAVEDESFYSSRFSMRDIRVTPNTSSPVRRQAKREYRGEEGNTNDDEDDEAEIKVEILNLLTGEVENEIDYRREESSSGSENRAFGRQKLALKRSSGADRLEKLGNCVRLDSMEPNLQYQMIYADADALGRRRFPENSHACMTCKKNLKLLRITRLERFEYCINDYINSRNGYPQIM